MILVLGRVHLTVLVYLGILVGLMYFKPALMFDAEGNPKSFGAKNTPTTSPFAPVFIMPLLAIILYFVFSVIALVSHSA